jgi:hypothetical protein
MLHKDTFVTLYTVAMAGSDSERQKAFCQDVWDFMNYIEIFPSVAGLHFMSNPLELFSKNHGEEYRKENEDPEDLVRSLSWNFIYLFCVWASFAAFVPR